MVKRKENKTIVTNRKALRDYHIESHFEAGLQLYGNEVKSLRAGEVNLNGSFAKVEGREIFLYNMHISPYEYCSDEQDPLRPKKLLLHKHEISQLIVKITQKGLTLVPTKIYFARGYAKVELGLATGKKQHDKRADLKEKQTMREAQKEVRSRNKR